MKKNEKLIKKVYQTPKIYQIGTFKESTLGHNFEDTADLKNFYN